MLRVYNTLTKTKEKFVPVKNGKIKMYVCGMTVYSDAHIGHARTYVAFDIIRRYLEYRGYEVTYVQTLPKRYGVKRTVQFTVVCLLISYALSLAAYFTGEFNTIYLYLDLALIAVGLVCIWIFAINPSPKLAHVLTFVFMMGEGTLICLAMILGSM